MELAFVMKTTWLESASPSGEPNDCYPGATLRTDSPNPTFAVGKMRTRKCHLLRVGAPLASIPIPALGAEVRQAKDFWLAPGWGQSSHGGRR